MGKRNNGEELMQNNHLNKGGDYFECGVSGMKLFKILC